MSEHAKTIQCDKKLTFEECELAILRASVDQAQEKIARRVVNSPQIQEMIDVVRNFIKSKDLIAYGGQAINEELPEDERFYNEEVDLPDYDFFSPHALQDTMELADLFHAKGFNEVEAKSGQHHGTYKVFVDFLPVADVTQIHKELYQTLKQEAVRVDGILYAPPNFLRMSMYLELSRPAGDTDRWEKVLKRLALLNQNYPLTRLDCRRVDFQRRMEEKYQGLEREIYDTIKNTLIDEDVVFFGGFAISNYLRYMTKTERDQVKHVADFDVLVKDPATAAQMVKKRLQEVGVKASDIKTKLRPAIGEIIPEQTEIKIGEDIVAVLYPPVACHSYNVIKLKGRKVKIATIDTMLSFYLAFLYANKPYYNVDRIICMANFLYLIQQKNRLQQKGLLRRFTITCYGHQPTKEELRAEKAKKYEELRNKKDTEEYQEWFFKYNPALKHMEPEPEPEPEYASKTTSVLNATTQKKSKSKTQSKKKKKKNQRNTKKRSFFDPYRAKK